MASVYLKLKSFVALSSEYSLLFFTAVLLLSAFRHSALLRAAEVFLAAPPEGWESMDDPAQLPQKIIRLYIGAGKNSNCFTPSLNIASESTTLSLQDYFSMAKSYHLKQANTSCRDLGLITAAFGQGRLLEINRLSEWGEIRFIQAFFLQEQTAYVLTATCLKSTFGALAPDLLRALQSFSQAK